MIALGGNVPIGTESPVMTLVRAVACLPDAGLTLRRVSRFFDTPCFPAGAGPDYVNAAVQFETGLKAPEVLSALHRVEAAFRRKREQRWAGRTLDLDLLAMGQEVLPDHETQITWQRLSAEEQARVAPDRLVLPHPRLQDRAFVLIPMADIAPDWTHPVLGKTVAEMLAALPQRDIDSVRPI
jgi:2-amino-4-hydroxy-6-hydroxymethyldihydropteridine diphosphokinase